MDPNNFKPFLVSVYDYHRFRIVGNTLKIFNKKIKVEEISAGEYDLNSYMAVVYTGTKPSKKEILALVEENNIQYVE